MPEVKDKKLNPKDIIKIKAVVELVDGREYGFTISKEETNNNIEQVLKNFAKSGSKYAFNKIREDFYGK